ncbi:GumC family protein [Marinibacterium sp. SX1]|uniref:GumC family protein n=1 Tax=Marinibacterium sp. SX1 TaxID=3388424 RepID=UPI003D168E68
MNTAFTRSEQMRIDPALRAGQKPRDPDAIELRGLLRLFARRWKLIFGAAIVAAVCVYLAVAQMTPVYSAQAKVLLDPGGAQLLTGDELLQTRTPSQQVINGELAILRSNLLIEDVIGQLGAERVLTIAPDLAALPADQQMDALVWAVRERLAVYAENDSYVIALSFQSPDPALARDFTNTLADRYLVRQTETRRETIRQAATWLEERLRVLGAEVATSEEQVAQMRTDSLIANGGTLENASQQIARLNNQLVEARAQRATAEAQVRQLEEALDAGGALGAVGVVTSPALEDLQTKAVELRQQEASWAQSVDVDHPRRAAILRELEQVDKEMSAEVQRILQKLRGEFEVARLSEQSLGETIMRMEERVVAISRGEISLRQLEREAQTARQTYEALLSRLTDTRTQERMQTSEARMIERATLPVTPNAPRPKLMAALAGSVVFAVVAVAVFLTEMTATTFRSAGEVRSETGLPVLAALPDGRWDGPRACLDALRDDPYAPFSEAMRKLRTRLMMRDEYAISTSAVVLSSVPGEGRSTVALALADMAVRAGRSAIVVDCDLREMGIGQQMGWWADHDLADVLAGVARVEDAICQPADTGFDVLVNARPHPDVAEELTAMALKPVIEQLKTIYEVVILEGPALLAAADSIIVAKAADSCIYVVEHDRTERSAVQDGLGLLHEMQVPIEGVVLNRVPAGT